MTLFFKKVIFPRRVFKRASFINKVKNGLIFEKIPKSMILQKRCSG
jgi:hypothetical protein